MNRLNRSKRWHYEKKVKKKAKKILKSWYSHDPNYSPNDKDIGRIAKTPKSCSCWMCCNERKRKKYVEVCHAIDDNGIEHRIQKIHTVPKKDRLTMQERKNLQSFQEQLKELK